MIPTSTNTSARAGSVNALACWRAAAACAVLALMSVHLLAEEPAPAPALEQERTKVAAQRARISAGIMKAEDEARRKQQQELADAQEMLDPVGLTIVAPAAPPGVELYTIQAEKVKFKSVLLCLARKARFELLFNSSVDQEALEEAITTDLRLVSLDDALHVLTGVVGLRYRTGRQENGALQVLIFKNGSASRSEPQQALRQDAVDVYTRLLLKYPEDDLAVTAYFQVAEIHFDQQEYALAAQDYKLLLDRDAEGRFTSPALLKLGRCYSKLGDYQAASKALYGFLDRAPEPDEAAEALLALARSAARAGKSGEANQAYRRLLLECPSVKGSKHALQGLADLLFDQKEYEGARRRYELLRKRHPRHNERFVLYRVAMCKMRQERWSAALADFAKVLAASNQDRIASECYHALAKCLDKSGGRLEALEAYLGAVERFPSNPAAHKARARVVELYRAMGLLDKAIAYGEGALKQIPPDTAGERLVTYQLARALLDAKRFDRAMVLFEKLAQARADEAPTADALVHAGDAARKLGKFDRAEALYRGALQAGPDDTQQQRALLGLGDSYLARGQYEKAALAYQGIDPSEKKR